MSKSSNYSPSLIIRYLSFLRVKVTANTIYLHAHYTGIICPQLPDHLYGMIQVNEAPHYYGSQAIYITNCPTGQERRGGDDVRICTGDGSSETGVWSGTAPLCVGKYMHIYNSMCIAIAISIS